MSAPSIGTCPEWLATKQDAARRARSRCRGPRCGSTSGAAWPPCQDDVLRPLGVEAEGVDAGGAERQRDARHAVGEGLSEQALAAPRRRRRRLARGADVRSAGAPRTARSMRTSACDAEARDAGGLWGTVGDRGEVRPGSPLWTSRGRRSTALCSAPRVSRWWTRSRSRRRSRRATSSPSSRRRARFRPTSSGEASRWLRTRYRIRIDPGVLERDGYLAGGDARRRRELEAALRDPDAKAIVAARGGYGAMRVVDEALVERARRRPRVDRRLQRRHRSARDGVASGGRVGPRAERHRARAPPPRRASAPRGSPRSSDRRHPACGAGFASFTEAGRGDRSSAATSRSSTRWPRRAAFACPTGRSSRSRTSPRRPTASTACSRRCISAGTWPRIGDRLRRLRALRPGPRRPHGRRGPRGADASPGHPRARGAPPSVTARTTRPSCSGCRRPCATTKFTSRRDAGRPRRNRDRARGGTFSRCAAGEAEPYALRVRGPARAPAPVRRPLLRPR